MGRSARLFIFPKSPLPGPVSVAIANAGGECSAPFGIVRPLRNGRISVSPFAPNLNSEATFRPAWGPDQLPPMGTCGAGQGWGTPTYLNAGAAVHLRMPDGSIDFAHLPIRDWPLIYSSSAPNQLKPGVYTLDNGSGGNDLGPFSTTFYLSEIAFAWTGQRRHRECWR